MMDIVDILRRQELNEGALWAMSLAADEIERLRLIISQMRDRLMDANAWPYDEEE